MSVLPIMNVLLGSSLTCLAITGITVVRHHVVRYRQLEAEHSAFLDFAEQKMAAIEHELTKTPAAPAKQSNGTSSLSAETVMIDGPASGLCSNNIDRQSRREQVPSGEWKIQKIHSSMKVGPESTDTLQEHRISTIGLTAGILTIAMI